MSERAIFLVGFMGSGKSAVGRCLARDLGREFVDTDERVESRAGRTIESIFAESGEGSFRRLEWEALESLGDAAGCVVAAGGGLFLGYRQRERIRRVGSSVWLDVSLATARRRVGPGEGRPLWIEGDPSELRAMFERRRAVYALAEVRVDADSDSPERVAESIRARIHGD